MLARGDGGRNLGFVVEGALEVRVDGAVVSTLGAGDVFGELAFILGAARTADVVAAVPGTRVVLVSLSAVERLDQADHTRVWRNLSELLARRLAATSAGYSRLLQSHEGG